MTTEGAARRARWPWLLLWAALSIALMVAARALPWERAFEQLRHLQAAWVLVAVAANLAILPLWALEWRLLSPKSFRASFRAMFEVVSVSAAVLNSVPFFAGEAAAVGLLIARAELSRGAALSVLAMDQLLVGFAKLVVLGAAAAVAPVPGWLRGGVWSIVGGVAALSLVLVPLAHRGAAVRERSRARSSAFGRLLARAAAWGAHLEALRDPARALRVALLALSKKSLELCAIVALQFAFGIEPSLSLALLVLAALAVTTLLPIAPANLGVYEATVFATYRLAGASAELALGMAIVQHLCFLLPMLLTGYVTLTVRQLGPQRATAA